MLGALTASLRFIRRRPGRIAGLYAVKIGAALLLARMLGSRAGMPLALGAGCALAVLLYAAPLATQGLSAGTLIALIGVASGMLLVYYQLVVASAAPAHARGSALAIGVCASKIGED